MKPVQLARWGSFHIGGRSVRADGLGTRPIRYSREWTESLSLDGTYAIEQMYVQFFEPAQPTGRPIVFWPGGGLCATVFETTPDDRPGWLDFFLRAGHPVYGADPVERGRSGWAMYPRFVPDEPIFMTAERAFESFRFGQAGGYHADPGRRRPIDGTQFPVSAFDRFVKQFVPRWASTGEAAKQAMRLLLERLGPAIVVAFSSGATQALQIAEQHPDLFAGLVLVEPAGVGNEADARALSGLPILALYGDFLDRHPLWPGIRQRVGDYLAPCLGEAGKARIIDLPSIGIQGNSHFLMLDRNNLDIAAIVRDWLAR